MPEAIALVTADWHVRKFDRVWYRRDALCGDTAWGIKQVISMAEKFDATRVLLLGDLFEQRMQQSDALAVMRKALDTWQQQKRAVYYIQGQHEKSTPPLLSAMHCWPQHIDGQTVMLGDVSMYGLDYRAPTEVEAALKAIPEGIDILATHQVWRDFMGEDRGDAWFNWAKPRIILTGDFHQTLDEQRGAQSIVSPGSLCMQTIIEPAEKFVYILWDNLHVERVPLKSRGYFEARINEPDELEVFLSTWNQHPARIPQAGVPLSVSTNIIRVWYRADIPDARKRLENRIGAEAHLFTKIVPIETQQLTADAERRVQAVLGGGLEGCIRTFYADNRRVCDDAVALAKASDVPEELFRIFKEYTCGTNSKRKGTLQAAAKKACGGDSGHDTGRTADVEA